MTGPRVLGEASGEVRACCRGDVVTTRKVRGCQEGAGHLWPTPLPVLASKLRIAEVLANPDGVIMTGERDLEDDLVLI